MTAIADMLMSRTIHKTLVVAPKKVADSTWHNEAAEWEHLSSLRVVRVIGTEKQRIKAMGGDAHVYVISRDQVCWLVDYHKALWPYDCVVFDESTSFKNYASKRFKAIKSMLPWIKRAYLLTGTPTGQAIDNLWAQLYLLDGGARLGRNITAFRNEYMVASTGYGRQQQYVKYDPRPGAPEKVLEKISDICVSLKADDYIDLPPLVRDTRVVELPEPVMRKYKDFKRTLLLDVDATKITAASATVLTGKLLQFCNGYVYDADGRAARVHAEKLEAYASLLDEIGDRCLVFYSYKSDLDGLREYAGNRRVRVYEGDDDLRDWNDGKIDVMIAHPSSCAYGLNLQRGGCHVIWFGLNWSFELNYQGDRRLFRQGTPYERVYIHYLVAKGGMDERVMEVVTGRKSAHDAAMSALMEEICESRPRQTIIDGSSCSQLAKNDQLVG